MSRCNIAKWVAFGAVALCFMTNRSAAHATEAKVVQIKAVVGLHSGTCGTKRVAQVARAIASLTASDLSFSHRCKCMYESKKDLIEIERGRDQYVPHGDLAYRYNVLFVSLEHPIMLPEQKSKALEVPVLELMVKAQPYDKNHNTIWIGHRSERDGKLLFVAYRIPDDRFDLGTPGNECGTMGS